MASIPAATMVLSTPELLEQILLELQIFDLLHAQSVNTTFKTTIDSSTKLQQALYFRPCANEPVYFVPGTDRDLPKLPDMHILGNFCFCPSGWLPVLQDFVGDVNTHPRPQVSDSSLEVYKTSSRTRLRDHLTRTPVFLNRLLLKSFPSFRKLFDSFDIGVTEVFQEDVFADASHKRAGRRPEASWRRMLLTQPPLHVVPAYELTFKPSGDIISLHHSNVLRTGWLGQHTTMEILQSQLSDFLGRGLRVKGKEAFESWHIGHDLRAIPVRRCADDTSYVEGDE